jgi:5-deoxy-glucuronate isomerase
MSLVVRGPVSPASAGWRYVGFEVVRPPVTRDTGTDEHCVVILSGTCSIGDWRDLGGRTDPWSGLPDAVYLPPGTRYAIEGDAEVAICSAPARDGAPARVLPGAAIEEETRGFGALERTIRPILMDGEAADALLVCEVLTPAGHWSSYPPHKHDRDAMPEESFLEETYYHRISPPHGFAFQRVYTADGSLDETVTVRDGDVVLVPRGYHTVSAPPGYDLYYLNVMAGPTRAWAVANDPDHDWILKRGIAT